MDHSARQGRLHRTRQRRPGHAVLALVLREVSAAHGRATGGYLWSIAEPVAGTAILTFAAGFLFAAPPIGTSFALFYASGLVPFLMFTAIANRVGTAILAARPLLAYPAVAPMDAVLARFVVAFWTEIVVAVILFSGVLLAHETGAIPDMRGLLTAAALTGLFGLAVGMANAWLFLRLPVWHVLWSVACRPLVLVSGVLFDASHLPAHLAALIAWNPVVHLVAATRAGLYGGAGPGADAAYVVLLSLAIIAASAFAIGRDGRRLIHRL
jgi:capsular polysaccharide transport system permease protein